MDKIDLVEYCLQVGDIGAKLDAKLEELESRFVKKFEILKDEFHTKLAEVKTHEKERFEKVEGELAIAKKSNQLLREEFDNRSAATMHKLVDIERTAERSSQYSQYETLEISGVPASIPDSEVQATVLKIVNMLLPEAIGNSDIQACHRRGGKFARGRILLKLVYRPLVHSILKGRLKLKDASLTDIDERLTSTIYINEHLTPYYANLRYMCKKLWDLKIISNFLVSGFKVKMQRTVVDRVHIITHTEDFKELLPTADLSAIYY